MGENRREKTGEDGEMERRYEEGGRERKIGLEGKGFVVYKVQEKEGAWRGKSSSGCLTCCLRRNRWGDPTFNKRSPTASTLCLSLVFGCSQGPSPS